MCFIDDFRGNSLGARERGAARGHRQAATCELQQARAAETRAQSPRAHGAAKITETRGPRVRLATPRWALIRLARLARA